MSSATADTYPESVGSWRPPTPTPPTSPPPHPAPAAAPRGAPVRRQLDFGDASAGAGAGDDLEDDEDFLIRVVDDIERGYNEAKRRAPPCVCGRGDCAVERDEQRDRWMYVCSSQPKCKHVSLYNEVDLNPKSPPDVRGDPKLGNPCVLNVPSTHVAEATTPINTVKLQGFIATTPIIVSPQAAVPTTPFKYNSQGVGAGTPIHVSPQGAGGISAVKVNPQGDKSNDNWPICQCTAGKCKVLRVGNKDFYVCHILKGQGACSHKVPLIDDVKESPETGTGYNNIMGDKHFKDSPVEKEDHGSNVVQVRDNNANGSAHPAQPNDDEWPFDIINDEIVPTAQVTSHAEVCQEPPSMPRQLIAMVNTPTKSPMAPYGTRSPMTPRPNDTCHRCGEIGHWACDCPKPSRGGCFECGMVGHYIANCPQLRGSRKQ